MAKSPGPVDTVSNNHSRLTDGDSERAAAKKQAVCREQFGQLHYRLLQEIQHVRCAFLVLDNATETQNSTELGAVNALLRRSLASLDQIHTDFDRWDVDSIQKGVTP